MQLQGFFEVGAVRDICEAQVGALMIRVVVQLAWLPPVNYAVQPFLEKQKRTKNISITEIRTLDLS